MEFLENNQILDMAEVCQRFPYVSEIIDGIEGLACSIIIEGERFKLQSPYSNPVSINIAGELDYHKKFFYKNSIYKEPLARALGLKKGESKPKIIDATAGMLGDSTLIYSFGCDVEAYERNPMAYILAKNALAIEGNPFKINFGHAANFETDAPVIYFDPMYEEKNDKTLPKKEMRIFREVVGIDLDAKTEALKLKNIAKRLVIKRSVKAPPIIENPSFSIKGKSTRYDVYLSLV